MKKTLLFMALLMLVASGCKKNEAVKETVDRSKYIGEYSYEITGTAKLNLTLIGESDFPISMDGTMTITEDPDDASKVNIVSKNFETYGTVSDEGLKIAKYSSSASGQDEYGAYSMTYTLENGMATLEDGILTWDADIAVEMNMTIVSEQVNGSGNGKVACKAVKK